MNLLEGERALLESDNQDLIVTTCRIRKRSVSGYTDIFLEHLCSIQVERESDTWLLVVGCVVGVGSLVAFGSPVPGAGVFGLLLATALVVRYFLTRADVVWFQSPRASICWDVQGRGTEYVTAVVDAVEAAKNARYAMICYRDRAL